MSDISFEIPLRITVSVGTPDSPLAETTKPIGTAIDSRFRVVDIDPDYANRMGYDPEFLGVNVPLPHLSEEQQQNAAKNSMAKPGDDATVLPYHHFSVVMNAQRQLAYYTAVNIDGKLGRKPQRTGDRWYYDPRIAESEQIGNDLYARNELDRGHLVRRLDPAWGSVNEALRANNDTFHFTNCSPQHARFNQNDETWQGIENYLLNQAQDEKLRLTIFTGPVFDAKDPLYRGVRLPLRFWKIAAYIRPDQSLSISAYLLDQKDLVENMKKFKPDVFQVTVETIIQQTMLDFSSLSISQVTLKSAPGQERTKEGINGKRLVQISDIIT